MSDGLKVSIVIPVYNALGLLKQCLKTVFEHGAALSFEVIVVDNGSAPDVVEWLLLTEASQPRLRHLRYDEPLGFARSVNAGAAVATGETLIVLNSDTLVTPAWMDELHRELEADPSLGALTPITNHAGDAAQMDFGTVDLTPAKALALFAKRAAAREKSKPSRVLYLPQRLTFFCVALRRSVWLQFNGLDEAYRVGNFEDDDLCMRLRVAGYRLGVAMDVFVYHFNNATFNANKISHGGWMSQNAATFAQRARAFSEAAVGEVPRWPKRSGSDISVVILPRAGGSLERTMQSLANQTILDFEVIQPGEAKSPIHPWIAYVTEGDILYPFHLEALHDALERKGSESIFADGWVQGASEVAAHPDAAKQIRKNPLLLSGWMHHSSLNPELLWEESVPMHWPRLTWEMLEAPALAAYPPPADQKEKFSAVGMAREGYRRLVPYETRLRLDRGVRKIIGRPLPDPDQVQIEKLAGHLDAQLAAGTDAGKFAVDTTLPAVFLFNAVAWHSVTQRQHHFARGLAERGHTVFWIEPALSPPRQWGTTRPLQQLAPGIFQVRLPGMGRDVYSMTWTETAVAAMAAALRQTASVYGVREAVSLVNYPRWQPLAMGLRARAGWKVISDCLDDQKAFAGVYQIVLHSYEDLLVDGADLVVTSSVILKERFPKPSMLLHNAADYDLFSSTPYGGQFDALPRPIVGFFGALADWLDMELIHAAALRFPEWTFVYIGPHTFSHSAVEVEWLRSTHLPNILVMPQMDPRPLASHLAGFDVCTMPFLDIPATRAMNPVKLYEYLAAGKPAIARDLPEVGHLVKGGAAGLISLYTTPKEFFEQLQAAVDSDSDELRERRQTFAKANDWNDRVDSLSKMILDLFPVVPAELGVPLVPTE